MKVLQNRTSEKINGIYPGHCVEATSEQAIELELAGMSVLLSGDPIPDKIFKLQDYEIKASSWELQKEQLAKQKEQKLAIEAARQAAIAEAARLAEEQAQKLKLEQELSTQLASFASPKEFYKKNVAKRARLANLASKQPTEFASNDQRPEPSPIENKKPLEIKTTIKKKK